MSGQFATFPPAGSSALNGALRQWPLGAPSSSAMGALRELLDKVNSGSETSQRPRYVASASEQTPHAPAASEVNQEVAVHFEKLKAITEDVALLPDGAEKPSETAIAWASDMLNQLKVDQLPPTRVVASAEGGVAICFVHGDKYADVEFLNTGEILGVVSNRRDRPVVWEVDRNSAGLARASARVREFMHTSTPEKNDPRRSRP
jgi:hypothetical protein